MRMVNVRRALKSDRQDANARPDTGKMPDTKARSFAPARKTASPGRLSADPDLIGPDGNP